MDLLLVKSPRVFNALLATDGARSAEAARLHASAALSVPKVGDARSEGRTCRAHVCAVCPTPARRLPGPALRYDPRSVRFSAPGPQAAYTRFFSSERFDEAEALRHLASASDAQLRYTGVVRAGRCGAWACVAGPSHGPSLPPPRPLPRLT